MLRNYFKIALRDLKKRKTYAALNILGLAIGLGCFLLIFEYVAHERSYDRFQDLGDRIVRVRLDSFRGGELMWKSATIYPAIAPAMKKDFPEVEDFCRLHDAELLLANDARNMKFSETKGYFADPSSLRMLEINLQKGDPASALSGPDQIIISEAMAKKYFGDEEPLGKRLTVRDPQGTWSYEVTGVFRDYPRNSHLTIEYLVSYATLGKLARIVWGDTTNATETSWGWYDFYSYILLQPGADWKTLEAKLPAFCDRHLNSREFARNNNIRNELALLPLSDIHLYSNYNQEAEVNGNGRAVSFLFLIAFFIIGIAWINYINLATACSMERAREIGVRKVLGALRVDLIRQFLTESVLLNVIALVVALLAVLELAPVFHKFIGRAEASGFNLPANYWLGTLAIFAAGALLAGLYPAFVLSGYQPGLVLKGVFKNRRNSQALRKGLIVAQFAASVALIAGTMIVYRQVEFMRQQSLGANINQTLVLDAAASLSDSLYQNAFQPFKNEALGISGVKNLTASSSVMGKEIYWTTSGRRLVADAGTITLFHLGVDYDFVPAYNLELKAGRNFSENFTTDNKTALLNEQAAKQLGFESIESAINQKIRRGGDTLTVIGVVANFHQQGLQKTIDPMIMLLRPNIRGYYSAKIQATEVQATVAALQKIWEKHFPADPFSFYFLDELFDRQYRADMIFGKVFGAFAFLAVLIACFGLLGLSAYNVVQRTKEIGVRKVLGASVVSIAGLLSKDFVKLVLAANLVAWPVAYFAMNRWLQDFAYRVNIGWWVFALAGGAALLIALLTVSLQAIKAALVNPVEALRYE
ncbi:ABC transporter permease [candidate division KSB1 bacterium]|nr:MAG: ABC transporter permease [candidate division KSB1 bacterium]MBC6950918.1 ABC transporter permease [candidate division KSB1 bacterium]MCE7939977.1 ABC transporter permease [Chlorobi bacterium CHB1]MDL1874868.1 FtsX-like permease family protein [Cytophagia bacterium CHB2]